MQAHKQSVRELLLDQLPILSSKELQARFKDVNLYFSMGQYPRWALSIEQPKESNNPLDILFAVDYDRDTVTDEFLEHYQQLMAMRMIDMCKSFELYPFLSFTF